jgi:hypothetical protein
MRLVCQQNNITDNNKRNPPYRLALILAAGKVYLIISSLFFPIVIVFIE